MSRLRLRVSHRDPSLVVAQGSTRRSYKPYAQAFGAKSTERAELVVMAVNCHTHMVKALQAIQRTASVPSNGNGARTRIRMALIGNYAAAALKRLKGERRG